MRSRCIEKCAMNFSDRSVLYPVFHGETYLPAADESCFFAFLAWCTLKSLATLLQGRISSSRAVQNTLGESAPRPTWYHSTKHAIVPRGGRLIASPTLGCTFFGVQSNFCHAAVGEDIILPRGKTPNDGKCWANSYPCPTFFHSTEHSVIQPGGKIPSSPTMDCMFLGVHSVSPCHDSAILGNVSMINRGST